MKKLSSGAKNTPNTKTPLSAKTSSAAPRSSTKTSPGAKTSPSGTKTPPTPPPFAAGLSFRKLFFVFLIASVIGAIYEDLYIGLTTGSWMVHRGVIYGPLNVIYGFGAVIMCIVLLRRSYKDWQIFLISAGLGGVTEYLLSLGQELVLHTRSWDYSTYFLNLNGRTTIPIMLFWGLLGLLFIKIIYPPLSRAIESIPPKIGATIFRVLLVLTVLNIVISWSALARQTLRHHDVPSFTPIGQFFDQFYSDERLQKAYPNMEVKI